MKNIFLLILISIASQTVYSQCCPYIDSVEIIPAIPNEDEETKVILTVTTPNLGEFINSSFEINGNVVLVEACYYSGFATALQTYIDTVNLGYLAAGDYNLTFVAQQSNNPQQCSVDDSQTVVDDFTVDVAGGVGELEVNPISVFPNPSADERIQVLTDLFIVQVDVFDEKGSMVLSFPNVNETGELEFNLSSVSRGIYIMNFYDEKGNSFTQEVVLQ